MHDREWDLILGSVFEHDNRKMPTGAELTALVKAWRLHVGATVTDVGVALERVREFYADGGKFMKPNDLKPVPAVRRPADRGIGEATGVACPWPDECMCTHDGGCVAGWIEVEPDGFRVGELERGSQLRREAAERGLGAMQALLWAGRILKDEFGPVPAAGARTTPCPRCRPEQAEAVAGAATRDIAMITLRKRSKQR